MNQPNQTNPEAELAAGRAAVAFKMSNADVLLKSPEFAWFIRECLESEIKSAHDAAMSTANTADDRSCDRARHIHAKLVEIRDWTQRAFDESREILAAAES